MAITAQDVNKLRKMTGAGMMDFESCQSYEKLVIDAEIIGMAKRLKEGLQPRDEVLALDLIRKHGHHADYLSDPHTLKWFEQELFLPSPVIDRRTYDSWANAEEKTILERTHKRVEDLLKKYEPSDMNEKLKIEKQIEKLKIKLDKINKEINEKLKKE